MAKTRTPTPIEATQSALEEVWRWRAEVHRAYARFPKKVRTARMCADGATLAAALGLATRPSSAKERAVD